MQSHHWPDLWHAPEKGTWKGQSMLLAIQRRSKDPGVVKYSTEENLSMDLYTKLKNHYLGAEEYIDEKIPKPFFDELLIVVYIDSDHAHDKVTRWSITGLLIFIGRMPVMFQSKRQGAVENSTYGAEFMAMKTAMEEVMSVRYMLRCLGVKLTNHPSSWKKHVAISYHMAHKVSAMKIVHPVKTKGDWNFADVLIKPQTRKTFAFLVGGMIC
eukprot:12175646-Ditylum_brightwellii.AAC.1